MPLSKGFLHIPWVFWALLSLALAVLWVFVGPHTRLQEEASMKFWLIRWGHALTWLLLAISFLLRGLAPAMSNLANGIAVAGAVVYGLFIFMTFVAK